MIRPNNLECFYLAITFQSSPTFALAYWALSSATKRKSFITLTPGAIFMAFISLLTVDDDLLDTPRNEISVH
jgi:hypothetical protein